MESERGRNAIILTHGHFDHAGSALALAREWDVPIYAHLLELPYMYGQIAVSAVRSHRRRIYGVRAAPDAADLP